MPALPARLPAGVAVLLLAAALPVVPGALANDGTLPDWAEVREVKVHTDLAGPVDFAIAPDGAVWYVELYGGNITRIDPRTGEKQVQHHVEVVKAFDERGLVGFALDPDVLRNGAFYIYYTVPDPADPDGGTNRFVRVEKGQEQLFLEIPAFKRHNGGRIAVAPDRTVFVSTGENEKGMVAQDPKSLLGKILRFNPDGTPHADNLDGYVYSIGHRNPYGLTVHPTTGQVYETENSRWQRDEVNQVDPGKNYGYPHCEGHSVAGKDDPCPAQYVRPMGEFYRNRTAAPTAIATLLGQLYWASWNEGSIHHIWWDDGSREWKDRIAYRTSPWTRVADVEAHADGRSLWFSTWTDIRKLEFPSLPPGVEQPYLLPWNKPGAGGSGGSGGGIGGNGTGSTGGNGTGGIGGATLDQPERPLPAAPATLGLGLGALAAAAWAGRRRVRP